MTNDVCSSKHREEANGEVAVLMFLVLTLLVEDRFLFFLPSNTSLVALAVLAFSETHCCFQRQQHRGTLGPRRPGLVRGSR